MSRAMLMGASMSDVYWCFAGQYAAQLHNNCVNRMTGRPPALGYTKRLIPVSQIFPFGARVKIIRDLQSKRALSAQTIGDPRTSLNSTVYQAEVDGVNDKSGFDATFMGYSSNPAVSLLLKHRDKSNRILHGHHIIVDPVGISTNPTIDRLCPNETLYQRAFDATGPRANTSQDMIDWSVDVEPSSLASVASLFILDDCKAFDITLPPKGVPIGLTLATDEDYLAPFLMRIDPGKPVYCKIPL